jgi:hypothetical protein
MQDSTVQNLIATLLNGGPAGVIALLMLVVAGLLWDRKRVFSDSAKKDQKIDVMIENYYKSSMAIGEAIGSIKVVLAEISVKLIK